MTDATAAPLIDKKPVRPQAVGRLVVLTLLGLLFVSPLIFMALTSLKNRVESAAVPPTLWPQDPTLDAYRSILTSPGTPVLRWFANSMVAATANSALVVATAALAAYPLARMDFRGKRIIFGLVSRISLFA
jgi:multiple sugar transport system permease protein